MLSRISVVGLCLLIAILPLPAPVWSQEEASERVGSEENSIAMESATEPEIAEQLAETHPFKRPGAKADPFKPLVKKTERLPVEIIRPDEKKDQKDVQPPAPKPLAIKVCGIVGKKDDRLALITFENKVYILRVGTEVENKFKVVAIEESSVIVYSNQEQIRKTFGL